MVVKMKNIDVVNALNNLGAFVKAQNTSETAFLSVGGQFAIKCNNNALLGVYKPYEETLNSLREEHKDNEKEFSQKAAELLNIEVDVDIRKVKEEDFKDGIKFDQIMLLDFMIEQ